MSKMSLQTLHLQTAIFQTRITVASEHGWISSFTTLHNLKLNHKGLYYLVEPCKGQTKLRGEGAASKQGRVGGHLSQQ